MSAGRPLRSGTPGQGRETRRTSGLRLTEAENRSGFHRILAEVTMEHVGLIVGMQIESLGPFQ